MGIDLLASVDDTKAAVMVPALTSAAGLVAGALITRDRSNAPDLGDPANALINLNGNDWGLAMPMPLPTVLYRVAPDGGTRPTIGVQVPVFVGRF